MTEFEKWVTNNWDTLKKVSPCPYSNLLGAGWKAALEWVLSEHGPLDERVHNADCARARIRKELEK